MRHVSLDGSVNHSSTDCKSPEGVTVGLIDSIIAISRVLRPRLSGAVSVAEREALADLHSDDDVRAVLNHAAFRGRPTQ